MDEQMDGRTDGQMDGQTDGRTNGQMDVWMDGKMDVARCRVAWHATGKKKEIYIDNC